MTLLLISFGFIIIILGLVYCVMPWCLPDLYAQVNWDKIPFKPSAMGVLFVGLSLIFIGIFIVLFGFNKLSSFWASIIGMSAFLSVVLLALDVTIMGFKRNRK